MKQKEKKARNRRTNEQIDKEVISELEKLVAEYGFGNVNLSALMKAANIEANVFYRRYGSMDNLYDRLAKQYDFWINDAIDVSSLNILGPKKFFAETFKTLYRNLSDNTVMQKLLLYEMSVINETTKRTAETRDIMNLNLIAFYGLSGNIWLVTFKISYLCLPLFYETRTTPSCHPSGCAYRQL